MDFTKSRTTQPKPDSPLPNLLILSTANLLAEFITYPLDSIKVRFQMSGAQNSAKNFNSLRECISHNNQTRGFKGLYTGLGLSMTRESLFHVLKFFSYEEVKDYFLAGVGGSGYYRRSLALVSASALALVPLNFLDISRIKMLNSSSLKPSGVAIAKAFLTDRDNFFRGYMLNFWRMAFFLAADLAGRDQTKLFLIKDKKYTTDSPIVQYGSIVVGAALGTFAMFPIDALRTRFYSQMAEGEKELFTKASRNFVYMVKNEGVLSLFRGFSLLMTRNVLMSVLGYVTYRNTKNVLDQQTK